MKKIFVSIIIFISSFTSSLGHNDHSNQFDFIEYELFRNNKLIGFHKYNFERKDEILTVNSEVEFKITKLGIDLYTYKAKSIENYKNDILFKFSSKTKQNKKKKYVNVTLDNVLKELTVDGSSYKGKTSMQNIVGTWWNHEIVKAKAQISAISGRVIEQNVKFIGKQVITLNGKEYNALHFNFSSSDKKLPKEKRLNTDIWYDEKSFLWLKASFDKKGYWEYKLKNYK